MYDIAQEFTIMELMYDFNIMYTRFGRDIQYFSLAMYIQLLHCIVTRNVMLLNIIVTVN